MPSFPGAFPVYPPPGNQPLFHTQGPNINAGPTATSAPNGISGQPSNSVGQQQGDDGSSKPENNTSSNVRYDDISDQNPPAENNNNDSWGNSGGNNNSGDNSDGWANGAGNSNSNGTDNLPSTECPANSNGNTDASNDNNNNNADTDWEKNNDTSNNNNGFGDNNGDGWGDNNDSGDNSGNNNNSNDNNDQGWDNRDSGNQQGGNDSGWANETQNNQSSGSGNNGWNNDQNKNPTPQNQANSWDNNWNNNATPSNQARNPSNGHNNTSASSGQPTAGNSHSHSRVLYGPHGPYYGAKSLARQGPPPDAEEEPRYDVPQAIAQSRGVTKQVQPGPGYLYVKKRCAPCYIDSLDEPYAKFVFKYRTREQLKDEIGIDIAGEPSGDEEVNALENLDKAELIQLVLRAKGALGGNIPEPAPMPTPSTKNGFEQISVPAPDLSFLHYSLPPVRNVSNNAGLGIRYSSSNQSSGGPSKQNNNGNGHENNWQNGNDCNNNAANNSGWDGAQERKPSTATHPPGASGAQSQGGPVQHGNTIHPQDPSRHSSGISPKDIRVHGAPPGPSLGDYSRLYSGAGAASGAPVMPGPPPPPPINFGAEGTVGGGQTNWANAPMGAGPRPPTPTMPPRPPSPINENEGAAWGEGGDAAAAQPQGGW
jgi:hypothetical protein